MGWLQVSVYILRCADGSYYTGLTKQEPEARAWEHNHDPIDSYTARRRPVQLVFAEVYDRITDAIARERQIKGWNRAKKEALIRSDYEALPALASRKKHGSVSPHPEVRSEAEPRRTRAGTQREETDTASLLAGALSHHGLILRGGFHPKPDEAGLEGAGTVLLVGNAGPAMWDAFAPHRDGAPDPLNRWTTRVIEPIAEEFGARALYPFGTPHWPFQRWAARAEPLHPSPLGLLIHPEYGLWHAYRAALLFPETLRIPTRETAASLCDSCAEKPCLSACPVSAFTMGEYDVPACAAHLATPTSTCTSLGCHARNACPVGEAWRYPQAQIRFHMAAFRRSVAPQKVRAPVDPGPG